MSEVISTEELVDKVIEGKSIHKPVSPDTVFSLIKESRDGLKYSSYNKLLSQFVLFNLSEWADYLNINRRTLERYKRNRKKLDISVSEKMLQIVVVINRGIEVFGSTQKFNTWLNTTNLALDKNKPKDLLDTNFGIGLVKDELTRIEHGIFA